jgi:thioredoxin
MAQLNADTSAPALVPLRSSSKLGTAAMRELATKAEFDAFLADAGAKGRSVFVDFTATWCGPCKAIAPTFEELASQNPQSDFVKVDVDDNQETAAALGIKAMPTFKAFKKGKEVAEMRGANPELLKAMVLEHGGDAWGAAGAGNSLGASADAAAAGMTDREKRLAALAARGL